MRNAGIENGSAAAFRRSCRLNPPEADIPGKRTVHIKDVRKEILNDENANLQF